MDLARDVGQSHSTTTVYTLTVRASDQGTPAADRRHDGHGHRGAGARRVHPGDHPGRLLQQHHGPKRQQPDQQRQLPHQPEFGGHVLTSADEETDQGTNYGSAMRGFVIPPTTGSYTFWIASDDSGELRISPDATQANAVVRATNASYTNPNTYNTFASQQSVALTLTAGQPYYIEARQKQGDGGNHLSIAWQGTEHLPAGDPGTVPRALP